MEFRDLKTQYDVLKESVDSRIQSVIDSAHYISGPEVKELEKKLAEYISVKHCITCASGTDAITLALMTLGIGDGDAVFVPDFTFFATGECPALVGATPIFVDVDVDTYNMDPERLEDAIIKVKSDGLYTPKAVIAVDLFGQPADYSEIRSICKKNGLLLVEDGAQGFGGSIGTRRACSFGDISTTSFFPAKPLGCYGDGGAIFTDNDDYAEYLHSICVHGKSGNDKYNNVRIGMNSRLDTLQAAILLAKFDVFKENEIAAVNKAADEYNNRLKGKGLKLPDVKKGFISSWAQYTVQLPEEIDRKHVQDEMNSIGIPTMVYYAKPMHKQGAFEGTYSAVADCPVTERLCKTVLSLPMHPYLKMEDIEIVTDKLVELIK